jgi:hypothetical protein
MNIYNVNEKLHSIRIKLQRNPLMGPGGEYTARTGGERLSIDDVCAFVKNRAGFSGNYNELVLHVKQFFDEAVYQICNGNRVDTGYFSMYPVVSGTFDSAQQNYNPEKNPVNLHFSVKTKFNRLAEGITVVIEGEAKGNGRIHEFLDVNSGAANRAYTPGGLFVITGRNIRAAGDDPDVGVYFVPPDNPSGAVKAESLAVNSPSRIVGTAPLVNNELYRIEIRTQYLGSTVRFLKTPRAITSGFILREGL